MQNTWSTKELQSWLHFFQKFHMNIVHTNPPLVAGFFRNSKSQGAGAMCLVCQLVGSLLSHMSSLGSTRISWLQANVLGYLLFPNSPVPKS